MAYSFNLNDFLEEIRAKSPNNTNETFLPKSFGYQKIEDKQISKDIIIIKEELYSKEETKIIAETTNCPDDVFISINIQGTIKYSDNKNSKENINCPNNIDIIKYSRNTKRCTHLKKDDQLKGLGIFIKKDYIEENLFKYLDDQKRYHIEKNYENDELTIFKSSLASTKTMHLAKQIYNSPFDGLLNNIYLQSKTYELIYEEFLSIIKKKGIQNNKIILTEKDKEALYKARELIIKNKTSYSINELSRKVALNENKLKYGFKHLFNTTPGNIMLEMKMYEAKKLLEESEYNATEIAQIIGYKYVQNFTNAFSKFFGKNPSEIMKKRKYYC
ncbi:hypothetical protein CP965_07085 [Halarcobacter mediterraneus]|uniref:HTH araC/xylS-type domain-containing protein n=1 Tax=Halarcobacter mediterraneus TaxID=2023153 RepID=A0A4Q1B5G3_9BACT|nr:AraC family transcriptional regulator [Halarcobacter mediterraneus]RXK13557.1 hypothetical protein CP965_07085 [Halarcobacter mediterraneus]